MTARPTPPKPRSDPSAPLLETHASVWWVEQDARLGARAIAVLDSLPADRRPFLCDISPWEVAMLVERGRLAVDVPLTHDDRIRQSHLVTFWRA